MAKKITRSQYEEIEAANEDGFWELHQALAEYTGIVAYAYESDAYCMKTKAKLLKKWGAEDGK